jgi:PAS domain S-box-containing protein
VGRDESRRIRVSEQSGAPLEIPVTTVPSDPDPRSPAAADAASDAVAEVAADGKILHLSPAFARLTGYRPGDALGRNVLEPVHPRDRPEVERIYRQAAREGVPAQLRFRHRHPDGGWRWLEVEVRSRREGGETRVVLVAREAPAPASPGHGLPAQPDAERLVTELSRELLGLEPEDFEEGLQRGLAASARLAGADRVQFYLADRAARGVGGHYQWTAEGFHQRDPGEMGDAIQRFPWSAQELLSGRVVHVPSPSELPPEAGAEREGFARDGVLAYLGLPIRQGERTVGFLDFSRTRPRPGWTATEISRLLLVAEVLSGTVRRLRAERRRRESEERLRLLTSQLQDTICELGTDGSVR